MSQNANREGIVLVGVASSDNSVGLQRGPEGPTRPAPTVQLQPSDLTTSVGQGPFQVVVSNLGAPVGSALLNQIAKSIVLKTWPEQGVVSATVSKTVDALGSQDADQFAHIYVTPAAPLADRWYAFSIDALPDGAVWPTTSNVLALNSGSHVTRFRVGPEPIVSGVRAYDKAKGTVIYVDFSERVSGEAQSLSISYGSGEEAPCHADSAVAFATGARASGNATGITPPPGAKADGASFANVALACTGAVDLQRTIQINVPSGIRATSDLAAVGSGTSTTVTIGPESWFGTSDGGRAFKPSRP